MIGQARTPLNRERVLAAAVALADAEGLPALTMRRLAADLGVEAMSLYYHLPGKNGLLDGLVETVIAEAVGRASAPRAAVDWRDTLRGWFLAAREVMLRHPGKLLTRRQLLAEVWGPGYENADGNLRVYMAQLRRKLEPDPSRPRYLLNEPGLGYRFEPSP